MKRHPFAASLLGMGLMAAMVVPSMSADEMTDEERKTPPEPVPQPNLITDANRPGETNRQFAARMKATAASAGGDEAKRSETKQSHVSGEGGR